MSADVAGRSETQSVKKLPSVLANLSFAQAGVVSRQQLSDSGFGWNYVDRRIELGMFREVSARVIALHPQPLTRLGQLWAATLHFDSHLLTGAAALELIGISPSSSGVIDLIGPRGGFTPPFRNARLHTTRRPLQPGDSHPPCTAVAISVLNAMAWAKTDRQAVFYALYAIQQKQVTLPDLRKEITGNPWNNTYRKAAPLLLTIESGVTTLTEKLFLDLCRAEGLPEPRRQVVFAVDSGKNRVADFVFGPNRNPVIVEIDGQGHLATAVRVDDVQRANELALLNAKVIRIPSHELFLNPAPYFGQIRAALKTAPAA